MKFLINSIDNIFQRNFCRNLYNLDRSVYNLDVYNEQKYNERVYKIYWTFENLYILKFLLIFTEPHKNFHG